MAESLVTGATGTKGGAERSSAGLPAAGRVTALVRDAARAGGWRTWGPSR